MHSIPHSTETSPPRQEKKVGGYGGENRFHYLASKLYTTFWPCISHHLRLHFLICKIDKTIPTEPNNILHMNCKPLHKCKIMHINFKQSTNVRFANFLARSEMKIGFYEVSFQTFTESMESLRLDAAAYKLQRGGQSRIPRENTAQREALGVSSVFWVFVRNKNSWASLQTC